ncbi:MAG: hypothetical protein U0Q07_08155 [Acidimicrobiales bacterium]
MPAVEQLGERRIVAQVDPAGLDLDDERGERLVDDLLAGPRVRRSDAARDPNVAAGRLVTTGVHLDLPLARTALTRRTSHVADRTRPRGLRCQARCQLA